MQNMNSHNLTSKNGISFHPETGVTYKYEIEDINETEQIIGSSDNRVRLVTKSKIEMLYKILSKTDNYYNILVQFENYSITSQSGEEAKIDSSSQRKKMEAFNGAAFTFNLSTKGKVTNLNGLKEFKENLVIANKTAAQSRIKISDGYFTEEYFTDMFEKISTILPGKTVFVNSSWIYKEPLEIGKLQNKILQCTLNSINSGIAYIKTVSAIEQTTAALNHTVEMNGKEEGFIEIDAATGMLVKKYQKSSIAGHLMIGMVDVGINVNRSSIITGKKI